MWKKLSANFSFVCQTSVVVLFSHFDFCEVCFVIATPTKMQGEREMVDHKSDNKM